MPWSPSLPEHCAPESEFLRFLSSTLHVCLPSPLALISSTFGVLSILCWLFAQLPQIYKNYRLQSAEGLSIFFLVEWCLGDTANLLGALFTHQAAWQVVIAAYYVSVDITLVVQYFWYTYLTRRPRKKGKGGASTSGLGFDGDDGEVIEGITPLLANVNNDESLSEEPTRSEPKDVEVTKKPTPETPFYSPSYSSYNANEKRRSGGVALREGSRGSLPIVSPKTVVLTTMLCAMVARAAPPPSSSATPPASDNAPPLNSSGPSAIETAGQIVSWMSTLLYLGSRLPQLYKNYVRKSTSGLSPLLFLAAFSGNFFYSASLLTNPKAWSDLPPYGGGGWADEHGSQRDEWILLATPFFLGAAGVLSLDALMGVQFLIYSSDRPSDSDSNIDNSVPYIGLEESAASSGRILSKFRAWFFGSRRREKDPAGESGGLLPSRSTTGYGTV